MSDSEPTNELRNCSLVRRLFVRWFIVRWFVGSLVVVVVRSLALVFGLWFLVFGFWCWALALASAVASALGIGFVRSMPAHCTVS